ncbi:MAG: hypothetical protein NTW86_07935 [Candidatus Sumerlaeota bacterium]|nr:hypothetical protein [Candidatus Sumerlaeota bacterium]
MITAKELIDEALRHEQLARLLRKTAEEMKRFESSGSSASLDPTPGINEREKGGSSARSRKEQLIAFLNEHGPSTRREILEHSGIPVGTIATLLVRKAEFEQTGKKWTVKKDKPPEGRQN